MYFIGKIYQIIAERKHCIVHNSALMLLPRKKKENEILEIKSRIGVVHTGSHKSCFSVKTNSGNIVVHPHSLKNFQMYAELVFFKITLSFSVIASKVK